VNGLLIDTSALSAFFRGHPGVIRAIQLSPYLFLNATVYGETHSGYWAGKSRHANVGSLMNFIESDRVEILSITQETSLRYAEIWHFLRKAGKPIPDNDMWIAATAWEHGLTLLTLDKHFLELPQILVHREGG
jgi:tRNA(fMet)-specific endonuclease VapC